MGQAKARGSFEQRQQKAIERDNEARRIREEREHAEFLERRARDLELREKREKDPARVYSPIGRSAHNRAVLLTAAAVAMSNSFTRV
jgi:hypothetical protein